MNPVRHHMIRAFDVVEKGEDYFRDLLEREKQLASQRYAGYKLQYKGSLYSARGSVGQSQEGQEEEEGT